MARNKKNKSEETFDSSDEEQVKRAEDKEKDLEEDLTSVLSNWRGRRFIYGLIHGTCHVSQRSHVPGDPDSTAFNEGSRSVGEALLEEVRAKHFNQYMTMMKENHGDA